jgi:hypothetical protein
VDNIIKIEYMIVINMEPLSKLSIDFVPNNEAFANWIEEKTSDEIRQILYDKFIALEENNDEPTVEITIEAFKQLSLILLRGSLYIRDSSNLRAVDRILRLIYPRSDRKTFMKGNTIFVNEYKFYFLRTESLIEIKLVEGDKSYDLHNNDNLVANGASLVGDIFTCKIMHKNYEYIRDVINFNDRYTRDAFRFSRRGTASPPVLEPAASADAAELLKGL